MDNTLHNKQASIVLQAAQLAAQGDKAGGEALIEQAWPHNHVSRTRRANSKLDRLRRFLADGFVCRYSGQLLLFLPLLELLSVLWPSTFPWHQNWRSDVTHDAFWTHSASLDHIIPVATSGAEDWDNWATTSAARNMVRSRFSLEGLGWSPDMGKSVPEWDGGVSVFMKLMERYRAEIESSSRARHFAEWQKVVRKVLDGR